MLLNAVVSKAELRALLEALTPLRIPIDERRGRGVTLGRCELDLVPGRGIRLSGDARITWDVAGVGVPIAIDAWQVLLAPRIVTRGDLCVLTFDPLLEELDLKHVPGFLCGKIAAAVREGIAKNEGRLGRVLAKSVALPHRMGAGALVLESTSATVEVGGDVLSLSVTLAPRVERPAITVAA